MKRQKERKTIEHPFYLPLDMIVIGYIIAYKEISGKEIECCTKEIDYFKGNERKIAVVCLHSKWIKNKSLLEKLCSNCIVDGGRIKRVGRTRSYLIIENLD